METLFTHVVNNNIAQRQRHLGQTTGEKNAELSVCSAAPYSYQTVEKNMKTFNIPGKRAEDGESDK